MQVDPKALDAPINDDQTVRDFFKELLIELWSDPYGFSGKRPFGNGGWDIDIIYALLRAGFIEGSCDEEGEFIYDEKLANQYVVELIKLHLFV